jgi:hypothetical protein
MSTLRISTKDSNQAGSLRDYLSQHGLNVIMLSSTELEIEGSDLSEELRTEISSWQHAHDLDITVDPLSQDVTESSEQSDGEWGDFDAPQREFILAPHWRRAKASLAPLGAAFSAGGERVRIGLGRISTWLHETEEKILARSRAGDEERKIAEEKAWTETVQPVETVQRAETPRPAAISVRERIQSAAAFLAAFNSRVRLTDGGKAAAFAGGIVMAGLIGIGLSVSHIDKTSAAPLDQGSTSRPVSPATLETNAQTQHRTKAVVPVPRDTARLPKPSPADSVQAARKQRRSAEVVVHRYENEAADDGPEVVTHYYQQKAVPQVRKTASNGVKRYSDMD